MIDRKLIERKVAKVFADMGHGDPATMDSLDVAETVMALEEEFGVTIGDEEAEECGADRAKFAALLERMGV